MIANIIDKPRPEGHTDLLGVDKFIMTLVEFIKNCQMPTTIRNSRRMGFWKNFNAQSD
jgi:hypothetical protein